MGDQTTRMVCRPQEQKPDLCFWRSTKLRPISAASNEFVPLTQQLLIIPNPESKMTIENQTFGTSSDSNFLDRRGPSTAGNSPGLERRQFSDSHSNLSDDAAELGKAIDQYKLMNRRRYISYEEMLSIVQSLGYKKS